MAGSGQEVVETVAAQLRAYYGPNAQVSELTVLSNGWESDVYGFRLQAGAQEQRCVLRCYFGREAAQTARREAAALRVLAGAGYPVPEVYRVEPEGATVGRPFLVMSYAPGELLWRRMLGPDAAPDYLGDFCALLARLHTLPISPDEVDSALIPRRTAAEQIEFLMGYTERFAVPGFAQAAAWLRANVQQVRPVALTPVHWDFHPANVLVADERRYCVIDWTQFELTDPRYDLAWTLLLIGTQANWTAAAAVRQGYEALNGPVEDLVFFEAAASAKRLFAVLVSLMQGAETLGMRPGAEQIMAGQLGPIAHVYQHWLALTSVPLAAAEERLAAYL
ncbi:MAG TPA: phosphotransferase family protein [Caldilineaceae bacterium]|nr:phosphotransferase family protein [Caldilineaceae bacterium]